MRCEHPAFQISKPVSANGQDAQILIQGARNGTSSVNQASLTLENYDSDLGTSGVLGQISGRVTNDVTNIGDMVFYSSADGSALTESMRLSSDGNVGIAGITSPTHVLHINGIGRATSTLWAVTSDERAKQNVKTITSATEVLLKFRPVTYEWKPEFKEKYEDSKPFRYGFISQEVEKIIPEMVSEIVETTKTDTINDFKVLDQEPLIPLLVRAIQEQQALIDALYSEKDVDSAKINELYNMIEVLANKSGISLDELKEAPETTSEAK